MSAASRLVESARQGGRVFRFALYLLDIAVIVVAALLAYYARFEGVVPHSFATAIPLAIGASVVVYLAVFTAFGLYRLVLRAVSIDTMLRISGAVLIGFAILAVGDYALQTSEGLRLIPFGVLFIQAILVLLGVAAVRAATRIVVYVRGTRGGKPAEWLLVNAGACPG